MRIKFVEKIRFRFMGRAVPYMKVIDEDVAGRVEAVQFINSAKERENSVICTWDGTGFEKDKDNPPITVIGDNGLTSRWFVAKGGKAISLYTRMSAFPNRERAIGAKALMDDAAEAMSLHPSMREKMIFMGIGILIGWIFIGPIMSGLMS